MKFDLKKPCANCPFRTDIPFYLRAERAVEIAESLRDKGESFPCHKTVDYDAGEDDDGNVVADRDRSNEQHCAGAAIILLKEDRPNQILQVGSRLGLIDLSRYDMGAPVFATMDDFVKANKDVP